MKYLKLILMSFIFIPQILFGQNIAGKVTDSEGNPLEFVNVVLLSLKDTTYIDGVTTDVKGEFSIVSNGKAGLLRFSRVGYSPLMIKADGHQAVKAVLEEDKNMLNEVVVKSDLPKTQLKGEGMITTIAGSYLEKAGTLEQVLKYVPNVMVTGGNVQVLGRGTPEFYVDGHKVVDMMELNRLKSDKIKSIEVINNPGARYSASTTCVIRITTKHHRGNGWGVDTSSSLSLNEQKQFSNTDAVSLNFYNKKFDLSGTLYCDYTNIEDDKRIRQLTYLENVWEKDNDIAQKYTNVNPYAQLSASYQLNDSSSLGMRVSYDRYAKNNGKGTMDAVVLKDLQATETSHSYYEMPANSTAVTTNAYYVGKIGKVSIDFNIDYYWYNKKERMHNEESLKSDAASHSSETVNTSRDSYSYQIASKIGLSVPLAGGNFSWGGEFSNNKRKSEYDILPANLLDGEKSTVRENMYSAFCDYSRNVGKLNFVVGLRYENVDFNYYNQGKYVPEQSKNFSDIFPSAAVSCPIGNSQIQVTYASDINRPSYYQLRNGIQYDNRYTYESGNPYLLPSISRNLGLNFAWKWLVLSAVYSHVSDEICSIVKPYNGNMQVSVMRPENIDGYDKAMASVSVSPTVGFWYPQLKAAISKQWFYMPNHDSKSLCNPMGTFQVNNTFDTKWFTASLLVDVQTDGNAGNCFAYGYWNADFSLYKALLKNRLTMQLYASDIFGTADRRSVLYSGKQNSSYIKSYSSSSVVLTVRYAFNAREKYKGTGAGIKQRRRL